MELKFPQDCLPWRIMISFFFDHNSPLLTEYAIRYDNKSWLIMSIM